MFKRFIWILTSSILGLTIGCASVSLPTNQETQTLLVIPFNIENSTAETWIRKFKLELSQSGKVVKTIYVPTVADDYIFVEGLDPGTYQIKRYVSYIASRKWRSVGDAGRESEFEISPIELDIKSDKLTLLDYVFRAEQFTDGGFINTWAGFKPLTIEKREAVVDGLSKIGGSGWNIMDPYFELQTELQSKYISSSSPTQLDLYTDSLSLDSLAQDDWSEWMKQSVFENRVDKEIDNKRYPVAIEGRYEKGVHQFRVVFKPYPKRGFVWAANWQMRQDHLVNKDIQYLGQGYKRIWIQSYYGLDRYLHKNRDTIQAVWIRLNDD